MTRTHEEYKMIMRDYQSGKLKYDQKLVESLHLISIDLLFDIREILRDITKQGVMVKRDG